MNVPVKTDLQRYDILRYGIRIGIKKSHEVAPGDFTTSIQPVIVRYCFPDFLILSQVHGLRQTTILYQNP